MRRIVYLVMAIALACLVYATLTRSVARGQAPATPTPLPTPSGCTTYTGSKAQSFELGQSAMQEVSDIVVPNPQDVSAITVTVDVSITGPGLAQGNFCEPNGCNSILWKSGDLAPLPQAQVVGFSFADDGPYTMANGNAFESGNYVPEVGTLDHIGQSAEGTYKLIIAYNPNDKGVVQLVDAGVVICLGGSATATPTATNTPTGTPTLTATVSLPFTGTVSGASALATGIVQIETFDQNANLVQVPGDNPVVNVTNGNFCFYGYGPGTPPPTPYSINGTPVPTAMPYQWCSVDVATAISPTYGCTMTLTANGYASSQDFTYSDFPWTGENQCLGNGYVDGWIDEEVPPDTYVYQFGTFFENDAPRCSVSNSISETIFAYVPLVLPNGQSSLYGPGTPVPAAYTTNFAGGTGFSLEVGVPGVSSWQAQAGVDVIACLQATPTPTPTTFPVPCPTQIATHPWWWSW